MSGERFVISLSVKKRIGGKRELFVWLWRYLLVIIFIL